MTVLVDAVTLAARLAQGGVLLVDCRKDLADPQAGRAAYDAGHLPGALHAELDTDLSDLGKQGLGRHPLPDAEAFAAVLARWGWTPEVEVVAYDAAGGAMAAARLWWMLRLVGARHVRVLDGGIAAWQRAGLALDVAPVAMPAPSRVDVAWDTRELVDASHLRDGLADGSLCVLDARAAPRYRGEVEPLDTKAGHVPGARNRPFQDNLREDGTFRPVAELREAFMSVIGAHAPTEVVHMCGSGVTACHNLLAMEHAGLHGSRLYAPSWSGWIADPARAVALGAEPGAPA